MSRSKRHFGYWDSLATTSLKRGTKEIELAESEKTGASPATNLDSPGRLLAVDLGAKRVGVAVCDELRITVSLLPAIERRSWKDLLHRVAAIIESYDARGLVIGLPLNLDGTEGSAATEARRLAENFRRSLSVPTYLQDERLTTFEAASRLRDAGRKELEILNQVDSESAAVILRDFIVNKPKPHRVNQI